MSGWIAPELQDSHLWGDATVQCRLCFSLCGELLHRPVEWPVIRTTQLGPWFCPFWWPTNGRILNYNHGVVRSIMFYYVAFLSILFFHLGFTNLLICVSLPFGYGLKATTLFWFVIINPLWYGCTWKCASSNPMISNYYRCYSGNF